MRTKIFIFLFVLLMPMALSSQIQIRANFSQYAHVDNPDDLICIFIRNTNMNKKLYLFNEMHSYDGGSFIIITLIGLNGKEICRDRLPFNYYNQRIVEFYTYDEKQASYDFGYFKVSKKQVKKVILNIFIKYKLEGESSMKFHEEKIELDATK